MAAGDARLAGRAAAEPAAFLHQPRPRRAMDGAVHAAAAKQAGIGGVHDGVDLQPRDVALDRPHPAVQCPFSGNTGDVERQHRAQPQRVLQMIVPRPPGLGMQQNRQPQPVQRQERDQPRRVRGGERDLVHRGGMRPDRGVVPPAKEGGGKPRPDLLAQPGRHLPALAIVIDMRMPAVDRRGLVDSLHCLSPFRRSLRLAPPARRCQRAHPCSLAAEQCAYIFATG